MSNEIGWQMKQANTNGHASVIFQHTAKKSKCTMHTLKPCQTIKQSRPINKTINVILFVYFIKGESVENQLYQTAEFRINTQPLQTTHNQNEMPLNASHNEVMNMHLLNEGSYQCMVRDNIFAFTYIRKSKQLCDLMCNQMFYYMTRTS